MIELEGGITGFPGVPDAISASGFLTGFCWRGKQLIIGNTVCKVHWSGGVLPQEILWKFRSSVYLLILL